MNEQEKDLNQQPGSEASTQEAPVMSASEKIQTEPTPFAGPDAAAEPTTAQQVPPQPAAPNFTQQAQPNYEQPQYTQPPQYTAQQPNTPPPYQPYYNAPQPQYQPQKTYYNTAPAGYQQKSRLAAGLLAILFGMFGVHNFYLGFTSRATLQLIITIVGLLLSVVVVGIFAVLAMLIWGFIEGVQILTANNPDRLYDANCVILRD